MFALVLLYLQSIIVVDGAVYKIERNLLTDSILHHETLNYPKELIYFNHNRVRRSLDPTEELQLNFKAHRRFFKLRLKRDVSVFANGAKFGNVENFQPANLYEGKLHDDPSSIVHGFIYDGIFEGRIRTGQGDEFYIESSKQYEHLNHTQHHSVIYNTKDILFPQPHFCGGIKASTQEHMNKELNRTVWKEKYVTFNGMDGHEDSHSRKRRSAFDPAKTECRLNIRADHTYVNYAKTSARAMYLMTQAVKSVSHIYEETDFDGSHKGQGYSIKIERIDVIPETACSLDATSIACQFTSPNIGVEKFLDLASLDDHSKYCLSYVFAHRDFSDGVLGLAWIGDTIGAGGICDPYQSISGKMKSLNTGIVTNLNYGRTVASKVTEITLAHEIGHNFGAQHDDANNAQCSPGGLSGNFIMFPRATSGSDPNNFNFSKCSKDYIWPVIKAKSGRCFKEKGAPICGNRIVEEGEDCDCGYDGEVSCDKDPCCVSAKENGDGCKFSNVAIGVPADQRCSPSLGFCCDKDTCRPYSTSNHICSKATDCSQASFCTSSSYKCPDPQKMNDTILCNNGTNVCINGACIGSLCRADPTKEECQCKAEKDLCKICCQNKNQSDTCKAHVSQTTNINIDLPPGSPCNNYDGYCDIISKCRKVDAEGPLARLKKWLFSSETFDNILDWMKEYWWACILIGLGLVLLMAGFIACCSVHTPSSNPNKPKPRQLTLPRTLSRRNRPLQPSAPTNPQGAPDKPPGYDTAIRGQRYPDSVEMR